MKLKIYQVDAFADSLFKGNPAAVIPLTEWIPDDLMQKIALENNLSETVFFVPVTGRPVISTSPDPVVIDNLVSEPSNEYDIRWFTPAVEINLCGHATLAAAYILFDVLREQKDVISFNSKSGQLIVKKEADGIFMNFPRWKPSKLNEIPAHLSTVLGNVEIKEVHQYRDLLVELADEQAVQRCNPNFSLMNQHFDKMIVTAPGSDCDFVSRFFAPAAGINEDPVTGSAHSQLIPYWSEKLNKQKMFAKQLSARGGEVICEDLGERVLMGGKSILYLTGEISI